MDLDWKNQKTAPQKCKHNIHVQLATSIAYLIFLLLYRYEIMFQCWNKTPKERPSFSILRAKFDFLITTQQDHMPYIDLNMDAFNPYYLNIPTNQDEDKPSSLETNEASDAGPAEV